MLKGSERSAKVPLGFRAFSLASKKTEWMSSAETFSSSLCLALDHLTIEIPAITETIEITTISSIRVKALENLVKALRHRRLLMSFLNFEDEYFCLIVSRVFLKKSLTLVLGGFAIKQSFFFALVFKILFRLKEPFLKLKKPL